MPGQSRKKTDMYIYLRSANFSDRKVIFGERRMPGGSLGNSALENAKVYNVDQSPVWIGRSSSLH